MKDHTSYKNAHMHDKTGESKYKISVHHDYDDKKVSDREAKKQSAKVNFLIKKSTSETVWE